MEFRQKINFVQKLSKVREVWIFKWSESFELWMWEAWAEWMRREKKICCLKSMSMTSSSVDRADYFFLSFHAVWHHINWFDLIIKQTRLDELSRFLKSSNWDVNRNVEIDLGIIDAGGYWQCHVWLSLEDWKTRKCLKYFWKKFNGTRNFVE